MKQALLILAVLGSGLLVGEARGYSQSQYDYKLSRYVQEQKAQHMLDAMEAVGVDTSNVTIEIRNKGRVISISGTVVTQDELERINRVVENFGPFRDARNYVKVKPVEAGDGIVVRLDVFKHVPQPAEAETNECGVCAGDTKCEKLYAEREELLKQLRPLVKRTINDRYVVFDKTAAPLVERFQKVTQALYASECFEVQKGKGMGMGPAKSGGAEQDAGSKPKSGD